MPSTAPFRTRSTLVKPTHVYAALLLAGALPAQAQFFGNSQGGTNFPQGAISFADAVVAFNPVVSGNSPSVPHQVPGSALGVPNYANQSNCTHTPQCTFVSLGQGGSLTLQFTDNLLTGSGNSQLDLWIFEVGTDVEDTSVEISSDGQQWFAVGKVSGSTRGVDIDAYGHGIHSRYAFVRLTDDPLEGSSSGHSAGADIDAVGAISSVAAVPEPATWALWLAGSAWLARRTRARRG